MLDTKTNAGSDSKSFPPNVDGDFETKAYRENSTVITPSKRTVLLGLVFLAVVGSTALFAEDHWAFQAVVRPTVPLVVDPRAWERDPIDAFVQDRLRIEDLEPSVEAARATLIRRVTLDLIGLPPRLTEFDEFLIDERPDAYERVMDRLLASPHYGERWARLWLDLCHYGDSDGHLTDQLRPFAWRYRDWVIQSLNSNLPFDQFTTAQLAGDLVGTDRRGAYVEADDPILGTGFLRQTLSNREGGADLEEYRVEQIVDRTSLVGSIWLGLTVGCARCHDHKYDPVSHVDFFQLYAFFDRVDEINLDAPLPAEREAYLQNRPEYERRRREASEPFQTGLQALQRRWEEKLLYAVAHPGEDYVWDRQWELLGLIWGGGLGEGQLEGTEIVKRPWDNRTVRQQDDLLDYFLERGSITDEKQFAELKLGELSKQLAAIKKEFRPAAAVPRAPVMLASLSPRTTYVHERGEFRSRGIDVEPAMPVWLLDSAKSPQQTPTANGNAATEKTRLELAEWLMSRANPLPSRVTVNRMWQEFFGRGIVTTSDDFGTRGAKPSHPQLLDWLAAEFIDGGWNVKGMHRRIVSSAAYRQSSHPRPDLITIDPDNALVARQASLRVPAEVVRDTTLATCGVLSTSLGGPGVYPPQNERVTMEAFGSNTWTTSPGADRYRRSIYTFIQRTSPFAQAITFDAPSPARSCSRRDRSNTPLQALTLLNDPAFFELSRSFAESLLQSNAVTDRQRVEMAFRLSLLRDGSQDEIDRLVKFIEQRRDSLLSEKSVDTELAVWTDLASALMNLHEFIVRD